MNNFGTNPKESFIQKANWDALYLLEENWKNDLEFYLFEIHFLESLIESHISELLLSVNLDELRELQIEVYELKNQCEYLISYIQNNLKCIVDIIDNVYIYDTLGFRIENEQLEEIITNFIEHERGAKKFIFSMIKTVLENKKPKMLWVFN